MIASLSHSELAMKTERSKISANKKISSQRGSNEEGAIERASEEETNSRLLLKGVDDSNEDKGDMYSAKNSLYRYYSFKTKESQLLQAW